MLYYFSGKESYLKKAALKKICDAVPCPEMNTAEFWEPSQELYSFIETMPFIGEKKVCVLHYFPEDKNFLDVLEGLYDGTDIYISVSTFPDRRKKIVKEVLELAQEKEFKKIDEQRLIQYVLNGLQVLGYSNEELVQAKGDLAKAFHAYILHADMDLECVQKHIKMIAFSGSLTKEHINAFAPDGSDLRAYLLSSMLLSRDFGCLGFARSLLEQGESVIGILSLVAYQIRICYKAVLFMDENYLSVIGIRNYQIYKDFKGYGAECYRKIYGLLMRDIGRIKNGEPSETVFLECLLESLIILREEDERYEL